MVENVEGKKCARVLNDRSFGFTHAYSRCVLGTPAGAARPAGPWHTYRSSHTSSPQGTYRRSIDARGPSRPQQNDPHDRSADAMLDAILDAVAATRRGSPTPDAIAATEGTKNRQPYPAPGKGDLEIYM